MPALFIFLFKVNIALVLFCLGYYLVLRHLTFYTLNRIYLVVAILFSTVYPKINISDFAQRHQQLTQPVKAVILNWKYPAQAFIKPINRPDYWQWAEVVFWIGAALLAMRLLIQLFSMYKLYRQSKPGYINHHKVRIIDKPTGPFSFWQSIFVNPSNHEPAELKAILQHEQIHVNDWHILDILLAELSTIFYWFNPGVWLMKKAVRENIEFITDRKILQNGIDRKAYQYSLLTVSLSASSPSIVNNFNMSTIKKRIIMMNTKKSSKFNLSRYAFLIPSVIVLLLIFSLSKAELVKNGVKAISADIAKINQSPIVTQSLMASNPVIANKLTNRKDSIPAKKSEKKLSEKNKTRNMHYIISASKGFGDDKDLNYVINGKIATREEFKKLEATADNINIDLMPAKDAKKFFDQFNNQNDVMFITTDDSEAGKQLREKIQKANGNNFVMANGDDSENKSFTIKVNPKVNTDVKVSKNLKVYTFSTVDAKPIIINDDEPMIVNFKYDKTTNKKRKVNTKSYKISKEDKVFNNIDVEPMVIFDNTISGLSDKLIIIDGKEASEADMRKLSAADIESITSRSGDDVTKQYGDKAKNGVVSITTKKTK